MSDEPIRAELRKLMNEIARLIDGAIKQSGSKCGFTLLMFDFGPDGFMNYISNAERKDMIKAMKVFIERNK